MGAPGGGKIKVVLVAQVFAEQNAAKRHPFLHF